MEHVEEVETVEDRVGRTVSFTLGASRRVTAFVQTWSRKQTRPARDDHRCEGNAGRVPEPAVRAACWRRSRTLGRLPEGQRIDQLPAQRSRWRRRQPSEAPVELPAPRASRLERARTTADPRAIPHGARLGRRRWKSSFHSDPPWSESARDSAGEAVPAAPNGASGMLPMRRRGAGQSRPGSTRREQEILHLAAEGYSNADIAKTLLVTEQTVSSAMVEHLPQARREKPDGRWARLQAIDKREASQTA